MFSCTSGLSTHQISVTNTSPFVITKNISRYCQMFGGRAKSSLVENHHCGGKEWRLKCHLYKEWLTWLPRLEPNHQPLAPSITAPSFVFFIARITRWEIILTIYWSTLFIASPCLMVINVSSINLRTWSTLLTALLLSDLSFAKNHSWNHLRFYIIFSLPEQTM